MDIRRRSYLETHVAVILFGFTAILGKLISLSAFQLVWWRVLLTSISLLAFNEIRKAYTKLDKSSRNKFLLIGILVGVHWVCFYGSIKYANASIALVTFATIALFTSLLNPLILKERLNKLDVTIGILIIPGMALIVNNIDTSLIIGFWIGILSAFLASLFTVFNKKFIKEADTLLITFLEMSGAWLFLTFCIPIYIFGFHNTMTFPSLIDLGYLLILSLLCTTLAYALSLKALKYISTFESNLIYNLEPIYGIVLAILILNEHKELSLNFYMGVTLILSLIFIHPVLSKKYSPNDA